MLYEEFKAEWEQLTRKPSPKDIDDLTDLGHYKDGIQTAMEGNSLDQLNWWAEHQERILRAIAYIVSVIEKLPDKIAEEEVEFDPSADVVVPSNTSRQRLGLSSRPTNSGIKPLEDTGLP